MNKKQLGACFNKIKLLILDVDGVLTKGEIIYDDKAENSKSLTLKMAWVYFFWGGPE